MENALADFRKVLSIDPKSESPGLLVARIEFKVDEETAKAIARIEQRLRAKTAGTAGNSPAPRDMTSSIAAPRVTPEEAARLFQQTIMVHAGPLGEHSVNGIALPMAIQVFRDAGIAKAETVRKNGDGSTVFNVTLADGI